jgi:hypothetical protein
MCDVAKGLKLLQEKASGNTPPDSSFCILQWGVI